MTTYKKFKNICVIPLLVLLCLLMLCSAVPQRAVRADETPSGSILDDFSGTGLDILKYPYKFDDYSLQVVQIAETENNELTVYVYQPSAGRLGILATSINILTDPENTTKRSNFKLELLGSDKTICKYKVVGLEFEQTPVRYYDISTIYRAYNSLIDLSQASTETTNEVAYPVDQVWTATTAEDGNVSYAYKTTETVKVTDYKDGFMRYMKKGDTTLSLYLDRHYVAFSLDREIDDLISVTVEYVRMEFTQVSFGGVLLDPLIDESTKKTESVTISHDDVFSNYYPEDFATHKSWCGIETTSEFIANEELRDDVRADIENKQWVLSYLNTDLINGPPTIGAMPITPYMGVHVSEVTFLQMQFEVDGTVYDVGVVDDKHTGELYPSNWEYPQRPDTRNWWERFSDSFSSFFNKVGDFFKTSFGGNWWTWILIAVVVVLFIVFFPVIGPLLLTALKWLVKGLWWLICLPFKGIAALITKIKDGSDGS